MNIWLMRGLPGSGKSRWVSDYLRSFEACQKAVKVLSTDAFHFEGDKYVFKPEKLAEFHNKTLVEYTRWLCDPSYASTRDDTASIIIDNINLAVWEIAPYYQLAEAFGHEPVVVQIECDPYVAARRNVHGVAPAQMMKMHRLLQKEELPVRWRTLVVLPSEQ